MMVTVYPSKKLGRVVLLHDYITLRNEKTDLEKEVQKWKELLQKSESDATRYAMKTLELRNELKEYKIENDRFCIELEETHDSLWSSQEAEGYANSEIDRLNKKVSDQQRIENSLQSEITRLRRENKLLKERIEDLTSTQVTIKDAEWGGGKGFDIFYVDECTEVSDAIWNEMCKTLEHERLKICGIKQSLERGNIPKFKIQVTPEQSRYVQKWIFAHGGEWVNHGWGKIISNTDSPYLIYGIDEDKLSFYHSHHRMDYKDNATPEITFDQFKEWAKPIEPEKQWSYKDFPSLTVVVGDGGYKYIAIGDNLSHVPGSTKDKEIFYYNRLQQLCKTDYSQYKVQPSPYFNANIRVIETTIDKLKVGDWWKFKNTCGDFTDIFGEITDIWTYHYVMDIKNNKLKCTYIGSRGDENKTTFYRDQKDEVYKFELK